MEKIKPTIYIPIEIKARELNSKILFAMRAAERGYRVYIGTKEGIKHIIETRKGKSGVYFYKSGNLRGRIELVKKHCESLIVLDEERGVAVDNESFIDAYHRTKDHKYIDKYFVLSDKHRRIISKMRPEMSDKICVTGWPRIDLWRKEFSSIYSDEVSRIRQEFGTFFLFSSDFGCVNDASVERLVRRLESQLKDQELIAAREARYRRFVRDFTAFLEVLREVEADPEFPQIVIRPHPAEDHSEWFKALKGFSRVKVVYRGEITPWLLASSGVVHRGCTTAVQSYYSGKPTFFWLPFNRDVDKDILPYRVSTQVHDTGELKDYLLRVLSGSYAQPRVNSEFMDEIYVTDRLACDCILDHVDGLGVAGEPCVRVGSVAKAMIAVRGHMAFLRDNFKVLRDDFKANRRNAKMHGGITAEEVARVAGNMAVLDHVTISNLINNVVVVEKSS
jgi:surface carbohydrate biosynthesis protein